MRHLTLWQHLALWLGVLILCAVLDQFVSVNTQLVVVFGLLAVGGALVAYGTIAKNKWGINLSAVSCPRCHSALPKLRRPTSLRQRLWGGSMCPACGVEVDKWGREIAPGT
jgi:hypothetical protein